MRWRAWKGVPPIEVYKLGEVYFVADGNHRVSVARANGFKDIDAYVTEIPVDPGIQPGDTLDQAIIKAERTRFMAETGSMNATRNWTSSSPGPAVSPIAADHVHDATGACWHAYERRGDEHRLALSDTDGRRAGDWYEHAYLPIVESIREPAVAAPVPRPHGRRSVRVDLGLHLRRLPPLGEKISPEEGADMLALQAHPRPSRKLWMA